MNERHDARLVPAAAVAWAASLAVHAGMAPAPALGVLVGMGATLAVVAWAWRHASGTRGAWSFLAVVGVPLAAAAVAVSTAGVATAQQRDAEQALVAAGPIDLHVAVVDEPRSSRGGAPRWMAPVRAEAWRTACTDTAPCEPWRRTRLMATVEVTSPLERGQRAVLTGSVSDGTRGPVMWRARVVRVEPASGLLPWRMAFLDATAALDPSVQGLVRGMVVGDTRAMPADQVQHMRRAGLAHLTAVSGAHFAVLTTAVLALASIRATPRALRALLVAGAAAAFAGMVGPEASVLRALAMASAVACALAWGRRPRGLPALACGVIALVVLVPDLARTPGFAMSVCAVAAIVLWAPRVAALLARTLTPGLARLAAIPVVAQAAVTPMLVTFDPGVGLYVVPANLLAGLLVLPIMACGLASLAVAPWHAGTGAALAEAAGWAARPLAWVARTAAEAPGAWWPLPAQAALPMACGVLAAAILATVAARRRLRQVSVGAGVACLAAAALWAPTDRETLEHWDAVACDVGQGAMLLIRAGPDAAVVIDAGPDPELAERCLRGHGVVHVPLLIVTHPHRDHDGGVTGVLSSAHVEHAWIAGAGVDATAARELAAAGVETEVPVPGARREVGVADVVVVSQLHHDADVAPNDASIAVLASGDRTGVLALGDLELEGQLRVAHALGGPLQVDVVTVPHHGSAVQEPALAALVDATVAVVMVGADNRHGHPTDEALELWAPEPTAVLRTDTCGAVGIARDADGLRWTSCPSGMAP